MATDSTDRGGSIPPHPSLRLIEHLEPDFSVCDQVVVDLSRVTSMNKAGARPLLEAHRLHQRRHGSFRLGEISLAAADFLESHPVFADILAPYPGFIGSSDWLSQ